MIASSASPLAWAPHVDAWVLVLGLLAGYYWALSAWGPRYAPTRRPATSRQQTYFLLGVLAIELAADWPFHGLADHLFSAHMAQHLILAYVAAPLLLLGTPSWLFRRLFQPAAVGNVVRFLTRPLIAFLLFNVWAAAYHWPPIVNLSVTSDLFHLAVHVLWVGTALVMWWPVLSPLPEMPHLSYPARMGYMFAQSFLPTVPASFLTFGGSPLYRTYLETTSALGVSPIDDQQIAGLLMKLGGGLLLWFVVAILFFRWQREEEHGEPDLLYWRDLAPELESTQR